mmetsp:Transcript_28285/g.64705  ORF Transcript_28285/g.64705 Transcript_28285/m.64705 type:complete len:82 (-) Transcript_28285:113-358(-)
MHGMFFMNNYKDFLQIIDIQSSGLMLSRKTMQYTSASRLSNHTIFLKDSCKSAIFSLLYPSIADITLCSIAHNSSFGLEFV